MNCLSPVQVKVSGEYKTAPCGKCIVCLKGKRAEWAFRLENELKNSSSAYFVTLTYDDQHLTINDSNQGQLIKKDVQDFLKRIRWSISTLSEKVPENAGKVANLRYFIVGEYGSKGQRPHYHCLFFNLPVNENVFMREKWLTDFIEKNWQNGSVDIGQVNEASIQYALKYILAPDYEPDNSTRQFALMSKRPYLGYMYEVQNKKMHLSSFTTVTTKVGGKKTVLPRILRDKIFNKTQRRIIAENMRCERNARLSSDNYFDEIMKNNTNFGLYDLNYQEQLTKSVINKSKKNNSL